MHEWLIERNISFEVVLDAHYEYCSVIDDRHYSAVGIMVDKGNSDSFRLTSLVKIHPDLQRPHIINKRKEDPFFSELYEFLLSQRILFTAIPELEPRLDEIRIYDEIDHHRLAKDLFFDMLHKLSVSARKVNDFIDKKIRDD